MFACVLFWGAGGNKAVPGAYLQRPRPALSRWSLVLRGCWGLRGFGVLGVLGLGFRGLGGLGV